VLVVVGRVADVAVLAMHEVAVIAVRDGTMPATGGMDVHVAGVRDVEPGCPFGDVVHVVLVRVVDVSVVQVVQVVLVGDGGMAAEPVMHVRMHIVRLVGHGRPGAAGGRIGDGRRMTPF
jgi:hypothetical protein